MSFTESMTDDEYDKRQFTRMRETIAAFEDGKLRLRVLITNLEALLSALRRDDAKWRAEFQHEWGKIEDAYAVSLDQGSSALGSEAQVLVKGALENLKKLVRDKLQ